MQSECGRYLSSVSDLYVGDEVSVLLEEIRELEGPGRGPDELQDFEIAGSQTGGVDTPADATTVHSWDSHAHYKHHIPGSSPTHSIFSGVVLYCDDTHLKTSTGIIRLLLVVRVSCFQFSKGSFSVLVLEMRTGPKTWFVETVPLVPDRAFHHWEQQNLTVCTENEPKITF